MKSMSMLKLVAAISIVICVGVGVYFFGLKSGSKEKESVGIDTELILEVRYADVIRLYVEDAYEYNTDLDFTNRMDRALYDISMVSDRDIAIDKFLSDCSDNDLYAIFGTASREKIKADLVQRVESSIYGVLRSLEPRIYILGVDRPNIQRVAGTNRISIELPGIKDQERVKKIISSSALLEFWAVGTPYDAEAVRAAIAQNNMLEGIEFKYDGGGCCVGVADKSCIEPINDILKDPANKALLPARTKLAWENKSVDGTTSGDYRLVVLKAKLMDGAGITNAEVQSIDPSWGGGFEVYMTMDAEYTARWAAITASYVGQQIAIVMDDVVYSAPVVQGRIDGASSITGDFTVQEAEDLAYILISNRMPVSPVIVSAEVRTW